jgi:phosphopantothenoylcysteine decarboxylase/phosphopantothenate--cysteine ligase
VILVRTNDILAAVGARPVKPLLVGFAAESENVEANAREKLVRKQLDFILANDIRDAFGKETNQAVLFSKEGERKELSGSKLAVAHGLWNAVRARLPRK